MTDMVRFEKGRLWHVVYIDGGDFGIVECQGDDCPRCAWEAEQLPRAIGTVVSVDREAGRLTVRGQ